MASGRGIHRSPAPGYLARYGAHRSLPVVAALWVNGIGAGNCWVATTDFSHVIAVIKAIWWYLSQFIRKSSAHPSRLLDLPGLA